MLTPSFELHQDEIFVTITIKAPFTKISETEIFLDGNDFKFFSKPYYLRLNLPGQLVEDDRSTAKYDADSGMFTIRFAKRHKAEVFEGLDMLTKLLAPSGVISASQPTIEVLDESASNGGHLEADVEEEEDFDWQIEQEPYTEADISLSGPKYGFANLRSGVFARLQTELHGIIDLEDADQTPASKRRELRLNDENKHFDEFCYLFDLYQNESILELLGYQPLWLEECKQINGGALADSVVQFSEREKEKLLKLPRKEYILDTTTARQSLLSLVDIIYAYCYNHRTTLGENTVESGWTVAKLSGTLSWLETYNSLKDVLASCYRRSLCYPLYRHWKLSALVQKDVHKIFRIGKKRILRCLLEIEDLLRESDPRYVLNDLYITDYCAWIQTVSTKQIDALARHLAKVKMTKENVDFDLELLEQAAVLAVEEENQTDQVTGAVNKLCLSTEVPPNQSDDKSMVNGLQDLNISKTGAKDDASTNDSSCGSSSEESGSEYTTDSDDSDSEDSTDSEQSDHLEISKDCVISTCSSSRLWCSDVTKPPCLENIIDEANVKGHGDNEPNRVYTEKLENTGSHSKHTTLCSGTDLLSSKKMDESGDLHEISTQPDESSCGGKPQELVKISRDKDTLNF